MSNREINKNYNEKKTPNPFNDDDILEMKVKQIVDERIREYMEPELKRANTMFKSATDMMAQIEKIQNALSDKIEKEQAETRREQQALADTIKDFIESETQMRVERTTSKKRRKPKIFKGFHLFEKWTHPNGNTNERVYNWYAGRTLNGKQLSVYVGKDKKKAKEKIKLWLEKRPEIAEAIEKETTEP